MTENHDVCRMNLDNLTRDYKRALDLERRRHTADAKLGAHLRAHLTSKRWKILKREQLQAWLDAADEAAK